MGLLDDAIREHLELKRRRGADASEVSRQESDALGPVRRTAEGQPDLSDAGELPAAEEPGADEFGDGHEVPAAPASWHEEQTAVHAAPPERSYEPPPVPSAAAEPPATYEPPAAYEPPPVPAPPPYTPAPPADPDPDFDPFPELADEEPAAELPQPEERHSLLSRFKRGRKQAQESAEPAPDPPTAAHEAEPPPASYAAPPPYAAPPAHEPDIVAADDEPEGEDLLEETPDFLEETPEHDRLWFEQRPPRDFDFDG
jgi:hypothetical protein